MQLSEWLHLKRRRSQQFECSMFVCMGQTEAADAVRERRFHAQDSSWRSRFCSPPYLPQRECPPAHKGR